MQTKPIGDNVTTMHLVMAAVLLLGILVLAYGYFYESKIALYMGVFVTAAGVLVGLYQMSTRSRK